MGEKELEGAAEVARMLGVTRQRLHQMVQTTPDFPQALAALAAGRIWQRAPVEEWIRQHPNRSKPGPKPRGGAAKKAEGRIDKVPS
jgi:predicted DNA-binding transcriptional regulator AlpA